jgi:hypothetical protein
VIGHLGHVWVTYGARVPEQGTSALVRAYVTVDEQCIDNAGFAGRFKVAETLS